MLLPSIALPLLSLAFATQQVQGIRYTLYMTSDGDRDFVATVREGNGRARIDFGDNGSYVLVTGGGGAGNRTVLFVDTEDREYRIVDDTTFERIIGSALRMVTRTGVVNIQLRDVRIAPERLGAGEPIAGHATRRYRLTQEYRALVGAFGIMGDEPIHQTVVTDYWVSPGLRLLRNPLLELLSGVETALAQRSASFVRRTAAARDSLFSGTPLRVVIRSQSSNGDETSKERRLEITGLEEVMLDPAIWTVPRGYRRREGDFSFDIF